MANSILVDTNVLLDILTDDPVWLPWSVTALQEAWANGPVIVNPIICAEVAPAFDCDWQRLDRWLRPSAFRREALPFEATVIAAAAHERYRKRGGTKTTPLPDFYIGAHAEHSGYTLLTRDINRYRTDFPKVKLISP